MATVTYPTPALDALIPSLLPQAKSDRAARYLEQGKQIVEKAVAEGSIFNVDLKDAKESLNRAIDYTLGDLHHSIWMENRAAFEFGVDHEQLHALTHGIVYLHQVAGRSKKVSKALPRFPFLAPLNAIYTELLPIADAMDALKSKVVMGRKPLENPKPVDMSNTAHCAICQRRLKLTSGKELVAHGFHISDGHGTYFGFRSDKCFGQGHLPYELSCDANRAYVVMLSKQLDTTTKYLARIDAGEITRVGQVERERKGRGQYEDVFRQYTLGEPKFPEVLNIARARTQHTINGVTSLIERQELLIKAWTPKPLPGEAA